MSALKPPRIQTDDPGAHELGDSSDEHFSDASEGHVNRLSASSAPQSPVPITRVERVDDRPAHGEVPGTPAYSQRTQDAVPDEMEIVPEGNRSRSASRLSQNDRPLTPGGTPIPKTVVEKVEPDKPSYGEVEGTAAKEMRMADAEPDEVVTAPAETRKTLDGSAGPGREDHSQLQASTVDDEPEPEPEPDAQTFFRGIWNKQEEPEQQQQEYEDYDENDDNEAGNDGDFGDDFDEFAEGGEDEDFGDFDEADASAPEPVPPEQPAPDILAGLPPLNLTSLSRPDIQKSIDPYIAAIFPSIPNSPQQQPPDEKPIPFLSDRSLSLWQQLVAPPPLQPPNWTRSRIRRLFLVSLGVPVDLDEILPPSKQKRLILPNINLQPSSSPRQSHAIERLKHSDANASSSSLDSKSGKLKKERTSHARKGPPPPPEFDANAAHHISSMTPEALAGLEDGELREHVFTLEGLNRRASEVLAYWLQRKDEGLKEKEALEGVIENLVGFVRDRKGR